MGEGTNVRKELEQAIERLEAQRSTLGNLAVDIAVKALRSKLRSMESPDREPPTHSGAALEGERKIVTVMFADVSGFTSLSENEDPESVRDLMNACFAILAPIVEKYEGNIDKFIGDEIMALFGAPVMHENDPVRALSAALEMSRALDDFNRERRLSLALHFGVNTGPVVAGGIGAGDRSDYSVMGDTVNTASRLEDISQPGEILVGPTTHKQAADLFEFRERESVRVKGKSDPIVFFELLGPKARHGDICDTPRRSVSAPLIGRDSELKLLENQIEELLKGHGGLVTIEGDAGLGKSRLVAELRDLKLCSDFPAPLQWYEGRAGSLGVSVSYGPFREILRQFAGVSWDDDSVLARTKLEMAMRSVIGDQTDEILPYLAALLAPSVGDQYVERIKYLDAEALRRQIFAASRRFFSSLAESSPLALVFEDLHWMDESSALLLKHLAPLTDRNPILILCTERPDPDFKASRVDRAAVEATDSRHVHIRLKPLSDTGALTLVSNLLLRTDIPVEVRETIVRKTEGNPLFVEEIVRSLIDVEDMRNEAESTVFGVHARSSSMRIPDTIQGVILARVDRLDTKTKIVLGDASVIGRSFFYRVLEKITYAGEELRSRLSKLMDMELIAEKRLTPEPEYLFRHALAHDATYQSILLRKRREVHERAARAIESLFADSLEERYGDLAHHYAQAQVWDKAHEYLLKAGDLSGRIAADGEALQLYTQALEAYSRAFGDQWDPLQRASLEGKIGEALFHRGEHSQAMEYLRRALGYLGKEIPVSSGRIRLGIGLEIIRQTLHRLLPGLLTHSPASSPAPEVKEEIRLYEIVAWIDAFSNYERLFLISVRAMNVSERAGFLPGTATGCMALGTISDLFRMFRLARYYHERSLATAERIQVPTSTALARIGFALHHICLGNWREAIDHGVMAAEQYQTSGDLHNRGYALYMVAVAHAYRGSFHKAETICEQIIKIGREGADSQVLCWGLSTLGYVLRCAGRLEDAVKALTEASGLAERTRDHAVRIWTLVELGRCGLRLGNLDDALRYFSAARELQKEHHKLALIWVSFHNAVAELDLALCEHASESDKRKTLKRAERSCGRALKQGKAFSGLKPEALRLKGVCLWLMGKSASAERNWRRSADLAEKKGQDYDLGATLLEMGRRANRRTEMDHGAEILEKLGVLSTPNEYDNGRRVDLPCDLN